MEKSVLAEIITLRAYQAGQDYQAMRKVRAEVAAFRKKIGRNKFERHRKVAAMLLESGKARTLRSAFAQAEKIARAD